MIREEEIKKQAEIYTDDVSNYTEWTDDEGWTDYNAAKFVEKHLSKALNGQMQILNTIG